MSRTDVRYAHGGAWHKVGRPDILPGIPPTATATALVVTPAPPAATGATETLTATIGPPGTPGSIQFFDGGTLLATVTVAANTASTTTVLADGTHSLTAVFAPVGNFLASTSPVVTYAVASGAVTTTLALAVAPSSPAAAGVSETYSATVTPSNAVGTVQFFDGASAIGAPVTVVAGAAATSSVLANGVRTLNATFTPTNSALFTSSSAPGVPYNVGATSVSLGVSPASPATGGATETLTATMTPTSATGSVSFYNGATLLTTVALTAGVATTTTVLAAGAHSLTAVYVPTGGFIASTSPVVGYTVTGSAVATATALAVSPQPSTTGTVETLTALITPSAAAGTVQFYDGTTAIGAPVTAVAGTTTKLIAVGDLGTGSTVPAQIAGYYADGSCAMFVSIGDNVYEGSQFSQWATVSFAGKVLRGGGAAVNQWVFPGTGHHDWGDSGTAGAAEAGATIHSPSDGLKPYFDSVVAGLLYGQVGQWYYMHGLSPSGWRVIHLSGSTHAPGAVGSFGTNGNPLIPVGGGDVTNKALTANVATLVANSGHGMLVGDAVTVALTVPDAKFDGVRTLTAVTATSISFASTAANVASTGAAGTVGTPQYRWFSDQLDQCVAKGLTPLVLWSDPFFATQDDHHTSEPTMRPLWYLLTQKVPGNALVLNSHKHNYERFDRMALNGTVDSVNGIVQVVVGTGGVGHYLFTTPVATGSLVRDATHFGVLELTLSPGQAVLRWIDATGGAVLDSVTLPMGSGAHAIKEAVTTTTLAGGLHSVNATFIPAVPASYAGSVAPSVPYTVIGPGVVLAVTPAGPSPVGTAETLTATLSPTAATGTVQFYDGSTLIATVTVAAGSASTTTTLGAGSHSLTAVYVPTGIFTGATSQVVTYVVASGAVVTTTALSVTPASPASHGVTETLTARLTPSNAVGTVQFFDGATAIGAPVALAAGVASRTTALTDGSHSLNANFIPTNSANFAASTAPSVPYQVGAVVTSSWIGRCMFGMSDRSTSKADHFANDAALSGGKFAIRRSYDTGFPSSYATAVFNPDPGLGVGSFWSFKPGTWSASFLGTTTLPVSSWPSDAITLLNILKGEPTKSFLMFTANHEPDGGGTGGFAAWADQDPVTYAPMCQRIRPIVDAANVYRKSLDPGYVPILYGPVMMEYSLRRTDAPFSGEAWVDHWYPGNGVFDYFGWDTYSNGLTTPKTPGAMMDRLYAYSQSGRVDSVTGQVHESLPMAIGEYGYSGTTEQLKIAAIQATKPYARAREIIAISYFNRGNSPGAFPADPASYADGPFAPDWKLHVGTSPANGSLNAWGALT